MPYPYHPGFNKSQNKGKALPNKDPEASETYFINNVTNNYFKEQ